MKEKQYDHMDNRIREAAEHTELPYDDLSWQKMESLLNKEDDKRRPFLWLIPVCCALLLGAGTMIWWNNKKDHQPVSSITGNQVKSPVNAIQPSDEQQVSQHVVAENTKNLRSSTGTATMTTSEVATPTKKTGTSVSKVNDQQTSVSKPQVSVVGINARQTNAVNIKQTDSGNKNDEQVATGNRRKRISQKGRSKATVFNGTATEKESDAISSNLQKADLIANTPDLLLKNPPTQNSNPTSTAKDSMGNEDTVSKTSVSKKAEIDSLQQKKEITPSVAAKEKDIKKNQGNKKGFFVQLAGGAEVSSVKLFSFNSNPIVPAYGIGLGYRFNNRWSLQTGLYASAKKYLAGPGDYKTEPGSYLSNVDIIKIDASCLVYEIPVTVQYYFLQRKDFELYAGAGMSSYIMKKETYDYDYLYNGYPYNSKSDFTGNKSFFGVLHLKAGMEKTFGNRLSALLEPIVHIPIGGVGEGKVKLYSIGMRAGLKFSFNK